MLARHPVLTALVLMLLTRVADAQDVKLIATAPDVEIRSVATGKWTAAEEGAILHPGDVLSTGYESQSVLEIAGNAYALVLPMTQLRVEEHGGEHGKTLTRLYLRIGSVRMKLLRRAADRQQLTVTTNTGVAKIGPVETLVSYAENFGMQMQVLKGLSRARAKHNGEVVASTGQTAKANERRARSPREVYRDRMAPDMTVPGSDDAEIEATRGFQSVAERPVADPATANSLVDIAELESADSALVFRYEVLAGQ